MFKVSPRSILGWIGGENAQDLVCTEEREKSNLKAHKACEYDKRAQPSFLSARSFS